jgi:hypothetical protein
MDAPEKVGKANRIVVPRSKRRGMAVYQVESGLFY